MPELRSIVATYSRPRQRLLLGIVICTCKVFLCRLSVPALWRTEPLHAHRNRDRGRHSRRGANARPRGRRALSAAPWRRAEGRFASRPARKHNVSFAVRRGVHCRRWCVAWALTIRPSRRRFAARLNSGVRPHANNSARSIDLPQPRRVLLRGNKRLIDRSRKVLRSAFSRGRNDDSPT